LSVNDGNNIAQQVVDIAYRVHKALGPGLLESVYEAIMASELSKRGLKVVRQCPVPITYEETRFEIGFRADLLVEGKVIVEVKSVADLAPIHKKQLLTYLKLFGQAIRHTDQLQCVPDQRRNYTSRQ
jgi:GxxExxY protein